MRLRPRAPRLRPERRLKADTRGVSISIEYILTVSALVALFTALSGTMLAGVNNTQEEVTEQELDRIGNEVANGLLKVDRLATEAEATPATDSFSTVIYLELPTTVIDRPYDIQFDDGDIVIRSQRLTHRVPVTVTHPVKLEGGLVTGDLRIVYDADAGAEITIEGA